MYQLRMASGSDAEALLEIYNQYIDTSITFEYLLPDIEEFRQRIHRTLTQYPYFVAEKEGIPVGYGYAGRLKERRTNGMQNYRCILIASRLGVV